MPIWGVCAEGWRVVVSAAVYRVSRTLDTEARRAVRKLRAKATFMEIAYARCKSVRTSFLALRFLVEWGRLSDRDGHELPIAEYGRAVGVSRAEAYRREAAFRLCFPMDELPTLWSIVRPLVNGSGYDATDYGGQAVFVGTLKAGRESVS